MDGSLQLWALVETFCQEIWLDKAAEFKPVQSPARNQGLNSFGFGEENRAFAKIRRIAQDAEATTPEFSAILQVFSLLRRINGPWPGTTGRASPAASITCSRWRLAIPAPNTRQANEGMTPEQPHLLAWHTQGETKNEDCSSTASPQLPPEYSPIVNADDSSHSLLDEPAKEIDNQQPVHFSSFS